MVFDLIRLGAAPLPMHRHRLAGTVYIDGQPATRLVCVFHRGTLVLLAAKWSFPSTGTWEISGLPEYAERDLLVLALDTTGAYNAEVADFVSQVTGS